MSARIFYFEHGAADAADPDPESDDPGPGYYIGSADWMTRNLDERVEAVAPVEDAALRERLDAILETLLADNRKVWEMNPDGTYDLQHPADGEPVVSAQSAFAEAAATASDGRGRSVDRRDRDPPLTPAELGAALVEIENSDG